ncbi:hypothetical protein V5O48_006817 [Marasmius crinis-equi]|uniref:Survival protein SurE-like phosphatase/nucleotidase domain-containing protein n=1 Tax=Marasmius crinis-equi TaxID=585013 RepID=A0ABR3FIE1_9AGAR
MRATGGIRLLLISSSIIPVLGQTKVLLTNDDGWATAMIRAQNDALKSGRYDVVLSCPAVDRSGTGSSTTTPTNLTTPCEFDTCPTGSPAIGFNATDPRLNYVNGFPVDAARFGIQTLAPPFFNGSRPDLVVSGPNIGNNLGPTVLISGTVGAACEAAKEGVPSLAFSASSRSISGVSYTTLESSPTSPGTLAALLYANLTTIFVDAILSDGTTPILPANISVNINYPPTTNCSSDADFSFIFTRINADPAATDADTCGSTHLPTESSVVAMDGCFASVSAFNATTKGDVDAATQGFVLGKLKNLITCLP